MNPPICNDKSAWKWRGDTRCLCGNEGCWRDMGGGSPYWDLCLKCGRVSHHDPEAPGSGRAVGIVDSAELALFILLHADKEE